MSESGWGVENLPFGAFSIDGGTPRIGVRLEDGVIDVGVIDLGVPAIAFAGPTLNPFLALGRDAWTTARARLQEAIASGEADRVTVALADVTLHCPIDPPDYVDFYSSIEHATNLGRMFRPDADPLLPNWKRLPVGYHGRSSSVVVSGTPVRRPLGQRPPAPDAEAPTFGPSTRLDFELELGFVTGDGPPLGTPITTAQAREHIFGVVLVNDWSARDIQRWEYVPLGPFLGKSFATSISPWVVPLDALEGARVPAPEQDPPVFDYLRTDEPWAFDIDLTASLAADGGEEATIARTNSRGLYWTMAQQLAHATINGANVRAGDLYASGTISGSEPGTYGSMIELSWGGRDDIEIAGGATRKFLEDGDTLTLRGRAGDVSLGECSGTILPALDGHS